MDLLLREPLNCDLRHVYETSPALTSTTFQPTSVPRSSTFISNQNRLWLSVLGYSLELVSQDTVLASISNSKPEAYSSHQSFLDMAAVPATMNLPGLQTRSGRVCSTDPAASRPSTPASAVSTPKRPAKKAGRTNAPVKGGKGGKGNAGENNGWPKVNRQHEDTEETLFLKKRLQELKSFFKKTSNAHATATSVLADKDLGNVVRRKDFLPGSADVLVILQDRVQERQDFLNAEYELMLQRERVNFEHQKALIEKQFRDHAENSQQEHLAFAKADLQKIEEARAHHEADDGDDRTVPDTNDQPMLWNSFPTDSYRGFNSNAVRSTISSLYNAGDSLWEGRHNFDEHVARQVIQEDVIQPALDQQLQEQLDTTKQNTIAKENLKRLTDAALSQSDASAPPPSHTPIQNRQNSPQGSNNLSRLADAAELVREPAKTPPKRKRASEEDSMPPPTTPHNGSNRRSNPRPLAPTPPKRRKSSPRALQPSPLKNDITSTLDPSYTSIQASAPPIPPLRFPAHINNHYPPLPPPPPIYPPAAPHHQPPQPPQQPPYNYHPYLQPSPYAASPPPPPPPPQTAAQRPSNRRRKAASPKNGPGSFEFRMVEPGKKKGGK